MFSLILCSRCGVITVVRAWHCSNNWAEFVGSRGLLPWNFELPAHPELMMLILLMRTIIIIDSINFE